jgi:hypothetical protein
MGMSDVSKNNLVKKTLKLILLCFSISLASMAFSQTRGFSRVPSKFIVELGKHVKKVKLDDVDETFEAFKIHWDEGHFTEDQQSLIIRISEHMLIKKFDINPHFNLFMKTVSAAKDSSVSNQVFDQWCNETYKIIKENKRAFIPILNASNSMFRNRAMYDSESKKWMLEGGDYRFLFNGSKVGIQFKNTTLICQGPDDAIFIDETSGIYDILNQKFYGNEGKVTWERVDLSPDSVFCTFGQYQIDASKGEIIVDTVLFTYAGVLDRPVKGSFHDRIASSRITKTKTDFTDSDYPRFYSYEKDLTLGSFNEGRVKFKGGFGLHGSTIQGRGDAQNKAIFEFYYEGTLTVEAKSSNFSMKDNKVTSRETQVRILTDSGEIYHPMVRMNYLIEKNLLTMSRGDKGIEQAPFFDSDHNIEFWVDAVIWNMDEPAIGFDMLNNDDKARFKSKNFYREFDYEKMTRGMMSYHPLDRMYQYAISTKKKEFTLAEYAASTGSKKNNLLPQMYMLADGGFIDFDYENEIIVPREKLFNYVRNHFGVWDYDVLTFSSVIAAKPNASLNLINFDLMIEGIRGFRFSDSQRVAAYPREQQIILKNNRRMIFDGKVSAGRFDFYGDKFDFNYETFTITSEKIDSMKLWYPDSTTGNFLIPVKTVLRDIYGTLYIDKPHNKSGLKEFPTYPKFESKAPSIIAYDKPYIKNGAYDKDIFRFEVKPFKIDSMDNFTAEGLTFPGTFVSGGILPEFDYEARIMDDYSLGFTRISPPEGYPMYGGKGKGMIDISMSEEGFKASGEIEYEGATIKSTSIELMPDSMNAKVESYVIKKNETFPSLIAQDVLGHWEPKKEEMIVHTNGHDVNVYTDGQKFEGKLTHKPNKLLGFGNLKWDDAELSSKEMLLKPDDTYADTSNIRIGDIDNGKISFLSSNVNSHVDFKSRKGEFKSNVLGQMTDMPYNMYATSMDHFTWNMDKRTILLENTSRLADTSSYFISKNPGHDDLKFQSTKALFDMNEGIIYAEEIPHIDIADSRVFPDEGKAVLEKEGRMQPLQNAKILAARKNKYHELYDCYLVIQGRLAMNGNGKHIYKDKHETGQEIFFSKMNITRDSTLEATGYIKDSTSFTLSPMIAYKGAVKLNSPEEYLKFDGYVKPLHTFIPYPSAWFRYEDRQNPKNIIIPTSDPTNEDRRGMEVTFNLAPKDSINMYPTFFNFKRTYSDLDITNDTGVLVYDEAKEAFIAGNRAYVLNKARKGNTMVFNEKERTIHTEGLLDLGLDLNDNFRLKTAGKISKHEDDTVFSAELFMAMTMRMPSEFTERLKKILEENAEGSPTISVDNTFVKRYVSEFIESDKEYEKVKKTIEDIGEIKADGDLKFDWIFSKADFTYSIPMGGMVSYDPVHLATFGDKIVNKKYNATTLIKKERSGTRFIFYFEITKFDWVYFEYYRNNLYVYSTDKEINDAIRLDAVKINSRDYQIRPASPLKATRFVEKMDNSIPK